MFSLQRRPPPEGPRGQGAFQQTHTPLSPHPMLPQRGEAGSEALVPMSKSTSPPRPRWKPMESDRPAAPIRLNFSRSCRLHPVQANKGFLRVKQCIAEPEGGKATTAKVLGYKAQVSDSFTTETHFLPRLLYEKTAQHSLTNQGPLRTDPMRSSRGRPILPAWGKMGTWGTGSSVGSHCCQRPITKERK